MGDIVQLDELTINKLAAGEVIERPTNVVKELVENSLDAGATSIIIEIKKGGKSLIRIQDNGKGMKLDDMELSIERHATSKIRKIEDLEKIGKNYSSKILGNGIGTTLSKKISEMHDGKIKYYNNEDKGVSVKITLNLL